MFSARAVRFLGTRLLSLVLADARRLGLDLDLGLGIC